MADTITQNSDAALYYYIGNATNSEGNTISHVEISRNSNFESTTVRSAANGKFLLVALDNATQITTTDKNSATWTKSESKRMTYQRAKSRFQSSNIYLPLVTELFGDSSYQSKIACVGDFDSGLGMCMGVKCYGSTGYAVSAYQATVRPTVSIRFVVTGSSPRFSLNYASGINDIYLSYGGTFAKKLSFTSSYVNLPTPSEISAGGNSSSNVIIHFQFGHTVSEVPAGFADGYNVSGAYIKDIWLNGFYSIGRAAFSNNTNLVSVNFGDTTEIKNSAFEGCSSLSTFYDRPHVFGGGVFKNSGLSQDMINTIMNDRMYYRGTENAENQGYFLRRKCIPDSMFEGCLNLTSIVIPDNVEYVGDSAFKNCSNASQITIGQMCYFIGFQAFSGCKRVATINIKKPGKGSHNTLGSNDKRTYFGWYNSSASGSGTYDEYSCWGYRTDRVGYSVSPSSRWVYWVGTSNPWGNPSTGYSYRDSHVMYLLYPTINGSSSWNGTAHYLTSTYYSQNESFCAFNTTGFSTTGGSPGGSSGGSSSGSSGSCTSGSSGSCTGSSGSSGYSGS